MFQIENAEPMPELKKNKYPFADLPVGGSFFVPRDVQTPKIVRNSAVAYAKRHGIELRVLTVAGGARCWRIS